jgi:hypothetical protein
METVINPSPKAVIQWGWTTDPKYGTPIEIGDQCEGNGGQLSENGLHNSQWVAWIWDQSLSQCVLEHGQDYVSPDTAPPFHGVHTVQNGILAEYQALGADGSLLGPPLTEEMPLAGGGMSPISPIRSVTAAM